MAPSTFLAYQDILCFERRYPKQNTVARLNSSILAKKNYFPKENFGLATPLGCLHSLLVNPALNVTKTY